MENQLRSDFFIGGVNVGFIYFVASSGIPSDPPYSIIYPICSSLDWINVVMPQSLFCL